MNIAESRSLTNQQTVLIVDDTPANLGVLVDQLDAHHFQVVVAQDGEEGIQRAHYVLPDIILLDVMMPGISGFDVCSRLKADERTQDIPVIFMTALTESRDKINGFEIGGVDYITKPFQIEEVVARINTHLSLRAMQQQLSEQNQQLQQAIKVRQQSEEELRRTLQEQERLLEHAGVGIAFLRQRRIIRCNQKLAVQTGYDIAELSDMPIEQLYAMEHTDEYVENTAGQALAQSGEYTSDIRYCRRDGSRFWGETILTRIERDELSQDEILVIHDIEQRKRAEALRVGQGRLFEMMATGSSLNDVLSSLVHLLESQQDGVLAGVFLVENGQRLRLSAAPSLPAVFQSHHRARFPEGEAIAEYASPDCTAVLNGQAVWLDNLEQLEEQESLCALTARQDGEACWLLPVMNQQGEVLGVLALYFREAQQRSQVDMEAVKMASRITAIAIERQRTAEKIHFMAHHDALTGLPNRILLEDRLEQSLLLAKRYGRQVSLLFLDLDHFKMINDSLGHKAGDELLCLIASRLQECARRTDTVVRWGGDEFVIILYDQPSSTQPVSPVLKRIKESIAEPIQLAGHELRVSCSMGFTSYPQDGQDVETLLSNADVAMYCAKENGRNNYKCYSPEMDSEGRDRLIIEEGLRHALDNNELLLHYQAQYELHSKRIIGMEALLRWQHPELGLLLPSKFIQLAESNGMIVPIGNWVLQTACKQNKAWQDAGLPKVCIAVNVSARQFHEQGLLEQVTQALSISGLEARYLELELTESMLMQDPQQAILTMYKLNELGVGLSIDDFGTGYSSLSSLKNFPVARLKIDRSFVTELASNEEDRSIAKAIISLGHSLNLKVIAEGVEEIAQLDFLNDCKCDEIQGFYFSHPIPSGEFEQLLSPSSPEKE